MIYVNQKLISVFKFIVLLGSTIPALLIINEMRKSFNSGSMAGVVGLSFMLLGALYLVGFAGAALYSGSIAYGITDFLLYPRRYLKSPPVTTTRQKGLIAEKKYHTAKTELLALRADFPASPEVSAMLVEIHGKIEQNPEMAIVDIKFYLNHRRCRYHRMNLPLAMRYADFQMELGDPQQAIEFLEKESKILFCYTAREKKVMLQRAEQLKNSIT